MASEHVLPGIGGAPRETVEEPTREIDPFRLLSPEERSRHYAAYLEILAQRNGPHDFPDPILPNREAFFREMREGRVRWRGPLDRRAFHALFSRVGGGEVGQRELWLHAAATCNEDEAFAVAEEIQRHVARGTAQTDPVELYVVLEERYHERMLIEACHLCGVEVQFRRPRWFVRLPIYLMQYLPQRIRYVGILCGEVVGCILFEALRDATTWFRDEPAVQQRLWRLCNEILTDETFHVVYCRLRLGPVAIRLARWLFLPLMLGVMMLEVPALRALGIGPRELWRRARRGLAVPPGFGWSERPA